MKIRYEYILMTIPMVLCKLYILCHNVILLLLFAFYMLCKQYQVDFGLILCKANRCIESITGDSVW